MNKYLGLDEETIHQISAVKCEDEKILNLRLSAFEVYKNMSLPTFGPDLSGLNLKKINYYDNPGKKVKRWEDLPSTIKKTYDELGLPEAEQKHLAGISAQYESEVLYKSLKENLSKKGVIFGSIEEGYTKHFALFSRYFGKLIPPSDNYFAALNSVVFSGGTFLYVPKNVKLDLPLSAYFQINRQQLGQFERTLIIVEEGASVHYVEGCSAPLYSEASLHSGVVEVFVGKGANVRYTTIQNWSKNVYNLVTKRALVSDHGLMQWVDGNIGSKVTMKYPTSILKGDYAKGELYSLALATKEQVQDTGGRIIHLGKHTSSRILSKSISKDGGQANFYGLVRIKHSAQGALTKSVCHSLLVNSDSVAKAYPKIEVENNTASASHEATVSRLEADKIDYLRSRGIRETRAEGLLVNGFVEEIIKEIPFEFAIELNRLINLEFKDNL